VGTFSGGVFRSTDDGNNWTEINNGVNNYVWSIVTNVEGHVFAGTSNGVYRSTNNGLNWAAINNGLIISNIYAMVIDYKGYAYAGSSLGGVYRSVDPTTPIQMANVRIAISAQWNMLSLPVSKADTRVISLFPNANSAAFSYNGNSYQEEDTLLNGLGYWLKFPNAEIVNLFGYSVTVDTITVSNGWNMISSLSVPLPVNSITSIPDGIVTSQFFGYTGIYENADTILPGKAYWVKVSEPGRLILNSTIARSATNQVKIVFINEMPPSPPDYSSGYSEVNNIPTDYFLEANYPNPFNPTTVIKYALPKAENVNLKIFNMLGQEIKTLVNGVQDAGFKSVVFEASNLSGGVYIYRLQAGAYVSMKKMILLK
jgi:hypothetical protein